MIPSQPTRLGKGDPPFARLATRAQCERQHSGCRDGLSWALITDGTVRAAERRMPNGSQVGVVGEPTRYEVITP